ncbi:MAG: sulfatase-like hydrolase/transferase [Spirosomaceae bacterium]|nr:sulfatase-like hydrolase/transferase [Spirosomataceae bacterium]
MKKIATLLCFLSFATIAQTTKPNIVLILADDLRADAVGCYGNPYVKTPNIDLLAQNGTRFERAYILGGDQGAVCAPSRAMLMSGKSFFRISAKLKGQTTLPMVLRKNGYQTYLTGKWHNEQEAVVAGFDQAKNIMFGGMNDHFKTNMQDMLPNGTFTEKQPKGFSTDVFCQTALDFLDNHDPKKPFFAYVPFTAPHDPRSPLPQYLAQYDERNIPIPANFMALHPFSFGNDMGGRDEFLAAHPRTVEDIRAQIADYYALITHLDEAVGRIVKKLKDRGLDKNTIIVFAADNGLAIGSHGLMGKQNLYEHSMRVPLIMSGVGIPKNQTRAAFAYLLDLFPTLCEMTKTTAPTDLDGKSLAKVIAGKSPSVRDEIFTGYISFQRAVRTDRYKLIRYPKINHTLFFDLKNDPYELVNLAEKPEYQAKIAEITTLLQQKQTQYGDNLPLTATELAPQTWDYRTLKRVPDQWQPKYNLDKYFKP